jgi:hypothetical protein
MSTKTQSPGPNPPTTSRKPRNVKQDELEPKIGRAGSAGGIVLESEQRKTKSKQKMEPTPAKTVAPSSTPAKAAASSSISAKNASHAVSPSTLASAPTPSSTGPSRQRRRPRKLNKEPSSQPTNATTVPTTATASAVDVTPLASTTELEALKSRVRGLEAKVEELYKSSGEARGARSPRRRGKGRKASTATQGPTTPPAESGKVEEIEDDEEEELVRLEGELEVARRDLEQYRPETRPRGKRTTSEETDYIEEIPRDDIGVENVADTSDRQITLTGSYRIPLPANVRMEDVKTIQSGVSAAQNVARSFLEQRRARQAVQDPQPAPKAKPAASTAVTKPKEDGGNQSWSEWFGGYSMAISRAVKNIEAEAALETQKTGTGRPAQGARTASAPSTKSSASIPKPKTSAKTAKSGQRPPLKARAGNLSSEQVSGLMG